MNYGGPRVCHHCRQPGHFLRDCPLRQVPNAAALLSGNGGDQGRAPAPQDNDGLLPAQNAIVPYRPPTANGGQGEGGRYNYQGVGQAHGGQQGQGYENNQGYGNNYRTGYQQRPRNNWWGDNPEEERDDRLERVWGWYSKEMETKDKERRAKEEKQKEEEEKKKIQATEEERAKAKREREEFEQSLGKMVRDNMKDVCSEVIGKKASTSQDTTAGRDDVARGEEARQEDTRRKQQEDRWSGRIRSQSTARETKA
ncbi:hypothetical protein CBR_g12482 [Chara braunii]|uniref:CCHC-type domain-containing protein n=1 Tax=Chara braunii TaxID=69332 RepID=A0A388JSF1_CHABU|nr:hypothetical protein CBR_g12482 [Chara braunii]|eukprot:GBG60744.1 hypothetical protein CBR_g12482 [Chara braunii]